MIVTFIVIDYSCNIRVIRKTTGIASGFAYDPLSRLDRVVPITVKIVPEYIQPLHFFFRDFHAGRVAVRVDDRRHRQSFFRFRV